MNAIKTLYGVGMDLSLGSRPLLSSISVFEVNGPYESFNPPDLDSFEKLSGLSPSRIGFSGSGNLSIGCEQFACAEPMLDVEMVLGMAPGANLTYWTTNVFPVPPMGNPVLQFLVDLANTAAPPWIHSMSWGPPESHLTQDEALRIDQELAKLCARGLTFVASSGDDGVNSREARGNPQQCGMSPQYPASSPWVTSVGGTFGPEYKIQERTCQTNDPTYHATTTSGGGFSRWYSMPAYQAAAVRTYLNNSASTVPPASTFNASNRAYPDLALVANNIDTITDQIFLPNGGTSASAPLFAGMLALILDARLQLGLPAFGLLNPALYQIAERVPDTFNDITVGDNRCTGIFGPNQTHTCCPFGFNASRGWDPVTGLGSVRFQKLKDELVAIGLGRYKQAASG
jgi:tripeptidyl-peptidase-1